MVCFVRLRMANIDVEVEEEVGGWSLRARSFAARTADFRTAPPETLALHIQGSRPRAVILGGIIEGPDLIARRSPSMSPAVPATPAGRTVLVKRGSTLSPKERALRGRIGAYTMLSRNDPRETTKAARVAFEGKFESEVDPEGVLDPAERARRAEMARKAHYARLSLASAEARRRKRSRRASGS